MIVAFCGQTQVPNKAYIKRKLNEVIIELENNVKDLKDGNTCFYFCGNADFDGIAKSECKLYKLNHKNTKLCFVTTSLNYTLLNDKNFLSDYDEVICPTLKIEKEKDIKSEFNKWIINQANYIIGYVNYPCSDAYRMLIYAKKNSKFYINLGNMRFDLLK